MFRLALVSLLLTGCATKSQSDAQEARIKALEDKVAAMEKTPGKGGPAAAPVNSAEEEAAGKIMTEIQESMKANDYATAKTKLAALRSQYADTRAGKAGERMATEINLIDSPAAPIEAEKWYQGNGEYSSSKATLLVFWEVWCPHCKKEIPELAQKEDALKAKGVQIVAMTKVTKSATDDKVMEFLKENKVKFPVGKEKDGSMSKAFAVSGIPAAALVKNGKVIWRGHPARLDDETLTKLLAG
jgi:thiol-disulfide isomerase/thioredoxin